jgi:hypothetical protein
MNVEKLTTEHINVYVRYPIEVIGTSLYTF